MDASSSNPSSPSASPPFKIQRTEPIAIAPPLNGSVSEEANNHNVKTEASETSTMPSSIPRKSSQPITSSPGEVSDSVTPQTGPLSVSSSKPEPLASTRVTKAPAIRIPPSQSVAASRSPRPTPRQKRQQEEDQDDSFYLKHQNKALATELKDLRYQVLALEREREARRESCRQAVTALERLRVSWGLLETAVLGMHQNGDSRGEGDSLQLPEGTPISTLPRDRYQGDAPPSSQGDREWTLALSRALEAVGTIKGTRECEVDQLSDHLAQRVQLLEDAIRGKIRGDTKSEEFENMDCILRELEVFRTEATSLKSQLTELTAARISVVERERRTRRDVYRLACGLLTKENFLAKFESAGEEGTDEDLNLKELEDQVREEAKTVKNPQKSETVETEAPVVTNGHVLMLEGKLKDALAQIKTRDDSIQEVCSYNVQKMLVEIMLSNNLSQMSKKCTEAELRVNELVAQQQSSGDVQKIQSLATVTGKAEIAASENTRLKRKLDRVEKGWAQSRADTEVAKSAVDSLRTTHDKRWAELTGLMVQSGNDETLSAVSDAVKGSEISIRLQSKLNQALENVRQSESVKENLKVALSMNASLKQKLEETKGKYTTLQQQVRKQQESVSDTTAATAAAADPAKEEKAMDRPERSEKMYKEYKRMRKDLVTLTASKDAAKAKLERAERERDNLMESNARLLQQLTEKDEMNANSLGTILHLKQVTEQLTAEKESLEQQAKSASQLALKARLTTNAKERVTEELLKEHEELEARRLLLEKELESATNELDKKLSEFSEASGKMKSLGSELEKVHSRNRELVQINAEKESEVTRLKDSLSKAEREAMEAASKLDDVAGSASHAGSTSSSFTVDQLTTQVAVLKGRLACPVCHYRDKECIIMRCRHMHCKQCVEERISNRSRKCPTCNNKFSDKDVEDIWLS